MPELLRQLQEGGRTGRKAGGAESGRVVQRNEQYGCSHRAYDAAAGEHAQCDYKSETTTTPSYRRGATPNLPKPPKAGTQNILRARKPLSAYVSH